MARIKEKIEDCLETEKKTEAVIELPTKAETQNNGITSTSKNLN